MRVLLFVFIVVISNDILAQGVENPILPRLTMTSNVPANLLAGRSCAFYSSNFTNEQLETIQTSFQKSGIDAVAYFKTELVFGGVDITQKIVDHLAKREISFIIILTKKMNGYSFIFTPFNSTPEFVNKDQGAWEVTNSSLVEALQIIYRTTVNNQPIKNLLVNSYPERNFPINIIEGRRSDFYAIDLKVDRLAVTWFQDADKDSTMARYFRENYPFSYGMVAPDIDKKELRNKGFHYVLSYVHTEGAIAREILGYQSSGSESAITSVTFPNGALQLKTLPAEATVYKFYMRHIESGNVFLGTKWDADVTWQDALRNQIKGFKAELKIP